MDSNPTTAVSDPSAYRRGVAFIVAGSVVSSTVGIAIRLMQEATAWQVLFYRSLGVVLFLLLVMGWRERGQVATLIRSVGWATLIAAVGLTVAFSGSIVALQKSSVANALFLYAAAPFMAAILGRVVLGERVRATTWVAISCAFFGVVVMVSEGISLGYAVGNLAALSGAAGFASYIVALRWGRLNDMLPSVLLAGLFGCGLSAAICFATGDGIQLSLHDTTLSLCMGVFQLGLALVLFTTGSKSVPAAELSLIAMTEILLAPIWVWLALGETAGPLTLIGGAILLAAIAGDAVGGLRQRPKF